MTKKLPPCGDLVRTHDRDRFLLSLSAPPDRREALWALFAFNHEIAKTREVAREPQLGRIRLQWWREAIEGVYQGRVLRHDIVEALAAAVRDYNLPQEPLQALIDAREFDVEGRSPGTFVELEMYADRTATPLNRLALMALGQQEDDKTLRAVSLGYALTGLVRAVPFHAAQGRRLLPKGEKDAEAVSVLAEKYFASVTPQGRYLRVARALGREYLRRIRKGRFRLADPRLERMPALLTLKVLSGISIG